MNGEAQSQDPWQVYPLHSAFTNQPSQTVDREFLQRCLGAFPSAPIDKPVETGDSTEIDGVRIQTLRWALGYGPSTEAWLLTPAQGSGPWPGVLALHDHGGFRFLGKEKIADGPSDNATAAHKASRENYNQRAWANDLARAGFAVLVHDLSTWGSRRFVADDLKQAEGAWQNVNIKVPLDPRDLEAVNRYNALANEREHTFAKWCAMLGTSVPGVFAYEDQVALGVLVHRPECVATSLSVIGHSGGGARAALLAALDERVSSAVIANMMTTYDGLPQHRAWIHTWQFWPPGWAPNADWPDILALRAGMPCLIMASEQDEGFLTAAQQQATEGLKRAWKSAGTQVDIDIHWHLHGHYFGIEEQRYAQQWLVNSCSI